MDHQLDTEIRKTFEALNESFSEVECGAFDLLNFMDRFTSFLHKIQECAPKLKGETLSNIHTFATTVEIVSEGLNELYSSTDAIADHVASDVTRLVDDALRAKGDVQDRTPAYVPLALEWLVNNLHNPYPSKAVKRTFASQSGCPKKDIDGWFTDIRKRIGWSALRRQSFGNKQADILAAAKCYAEGEVFPYPYDVEISFAKIEAKARKLYNSKLREPYPTPEPSPERRSPRVLTPCPAFEDCSPSPEDRRSSTPNSLFEEDLTSDSVSSLFRLSNLPILNTGLLSPDSSLDKHRLREVSAAPDAVVNSAHTSSKRKRRISDASDERPAKRLPPQIVPRLQAASNPFPMTSNIEASPDTWVYDLFDDVNLNITSAPLDAPFPASGELEVDFSALLPPSLPDSFEISDVQFQDSPADSQSPVQTSLVGFVHNDYPDNALYDYNSLQNQYCSSSSDREKWLPSDFSPIPDVEAMLDQFGSWNPGSANPVQGHLQCPSSQLPISYFSAPAPRGFISMHQEEAIHDLVPLRSIDFSFDGLVSDVPTGPSTVTQDALAAPAVDKTDLLHELKALQQKVAHLEAQLQAAP